MQNLKRTLFKALEALGEDWANNHVPSDIIRRPESFDVLIAVRHLVADRSSNISVQMLQKHAPTFLQQHDEATLRNLEDIACECC